MTRRYSEGKSIDAVIRFIEMRDNAIRRADGRSPDDLHDKNPQRRVDYVCTVEDQLYAFEHTGIEPFSNQILMEIKNGKLFDPIVKYYNSGRPDTEFWELYVPADASTYLTDATVKRVRQALIQWINGSAALFPLARYGDRFANPVLGENATGVPFPVSLHRWSLADSSPLCGRFCVRPFVRGDLENARIARLQRACREKFPKLEAWKRSDSARTMLVLEENDISTTNHQLVADAMSIAEEGIPDKPDEVFLVSTYITDLWWVTCLRRGGKTYYDDGERFHEFIPSDLTSLTKR
jgi:hypothetical protein